MPPFASSSIVGAEVLVGSVIGRKKREVSELTGGGSVSGSSPGCWGAPPEPASAGSSGCWLGRPPVVLDPESEPASPAGESSPEPASEEPERPPVASRPPEPSESSASSVETSQATAPKAKTESTSAVNRTVISTPSRAPSSARHVPPSITGDCNRARIAAEIPGSGLVSSPSRVGFAAASGRPRVRPSGADECPGRTDVRTCRDRAGIARPLCPRVTVGACRSKSPRDGSEQGGGTDARGDARGARHDSRQPPVARGAADVVHLDRDGDPDAVRAGRHLLGGAARQGSRRGGGAVEQLDVRVAGADADVVGRLRGAGLASSGAQGSSGGAAAVQPGAELRDLRGVRIPGARVGLRAHLRRAPLG